jgi:hypothetical protein
MNSTITCPYCKESFEISDAISKQMDEELKKAKEKQSKTLRMEYEQDAKTKIKQEIQKALDEQKQEAEIQLEKAKQSKKMEIEKLHIQAECEKENAEKLRKEMKDLLTELNKANREKADAQLSAQKELLQKAASIRREAEKKTSESFNLKISEKEETIKKLHQQLRDAKQVAEQGSQQLQGEILELNIEQNLRDAFRLDEIKEVKKGERGSDIRQIINEPSYQNCGLILWECKNAKTYQGSWLSKLKEEVAAEKAQVGIIAFSSMDGDDDFKRLADNIWLIRPRYSVMLATFLRQVCIKTFIANRNAEGKDIKTDMLYKYLTGGEFTNRIRAIIESYNEMARQFDTDKRLTQKRWAAQEKTLQKIEKGLYSMSGDLQGIAGKEIIALPALEYGDEASATEG